MAQATAGRISAGKAFVEIVADKANLIKGLKSVQKDIKAFGQSLKDLGSDMFILGGFSSVPLLKSIKMFAEFDDRIRTLKGVSGATESTMKDLKETIMDLGATTAFTANQVAEGAIELARIGFEADEVKKAIKPTLDLVRATGESVNKLGEYAGYASSVLKIFKKNADDFNNVTNIMAYSANKSAMSIADYYESMKMAGPYAQMVGESIEGASSALMLMANMGVRGSLAGTSLRNVYQVLAAAAGKLTDVTDEENNAIATNLESLETLGIRLKDTRGNLLSVAQIMDSIKNKLKEMPKNDKLNFLIEQFGLRGSLGASSMLNDYDNYFQEQEKALKKLLKAEREYKEKISKHQEGGAGGFLRGLISRWEAIQITVGEGFWETIKNASQAILGFVSGILKFIQENKKLVSSVVFATGSIFTLGITIFGVGMIIKILGASLGMVIVPLSIFTKTIITTGKGVYYLYRGLRMLTSSTPKALLTSFVWLKNTFNSIDFNSINNSFNKVSQVIKKNLGVINGVINISLKNISKFGDTFSNALKKVSSSNFVRNIKSVTEMTRGVEYSKILQQGKGNDLFNSRKAFQGFKYRLKSNNSHGIVGMIRSYKLLRKSFMALSFEFSTRGPAAFSVFKATVKQNIGVMKNFAKSLLAPVNNFFAITKQMTAFNLSLNKSFAFNGLSKNMSKVFASQQAFVKLMFLLKTSSSGTFVTLYKNNKLLRQSFSYLMFAMTTSVKTFVSSFNTFVIKDFFKNIKTNLANIPRNISNFVGFTREMIKFNLKLNKASAAFGPSRKLVNSYNAFQKLSRILKVTDRNILVSLIRNVGLLTKSFTYFGTVVSTVFFTVLNSLKITTIGSAFAKIFSGIKKVTMSIFSMQNIQKVLLGTKTAFLSIKSAVVSVAMAVKALFVAFHGGAIVSFLTPFLAIGGAVVAGVYVWKRYGDAMKSAFKNSKFLNDFKRDFSNAWKNIKDTGTKTFASIKEAFEVGDLAGGFKIAFAGIKDMLLEAIDPFIKRWFYLYESFYPHFGFLRDTINWISKKIDKWVVEDSIEEKHRKEREKEFREGIEYIDPATGEKKHVYNAYLAGAMDTENTPGIIKWDKIAAKNKLLSGGQEVEDYGIEKASLFFGKTFGKLTPEEQLFLREYKKNEMRRAKELKEGTKKAEEKPELFSKTFSAADAIKNFEKLKQETKNKFQEQLYSNSSFAGNTKFLREIAERFNNNAQEEYNLSYDSIYKNKQIKRDIGYYDNMPKMTAEYELRTAIINTMSQIKHIEKEFKKVQKLSMINGHKDTVDANEQMRMIELIKSKGYLLTRKQELESRLSGLNQTTGQAIQEKTQNAIGAWSFAELKNSFGKSIAQKTLDANLKANDYLRKIEKNSKKDLTSLGVQYL